MNLIKLTAHIYYTEPDPATDRPVLGYIRGEKRCIMVDAGNSADHAKGYIKCVKEQGFKEPDACVITHWHWDHTFGLHCLLMDTFACDKTNEKLRELSQWEWTDEAMKDRLARGVEIPFADEHIRAEYEDVGQIRVVAAKKDIVDEVSFDCGDVTCRCIHLPSAHSDDSIAVYIPEEKVLFIGDLYGDDYYRDHYRDMEKTRELYESLQTLDFTLAVPGHSAPLSRERLLGYLAGTIEKGE